MNIRKLLYGTVFLRSTATGMVGVLFGIYLAQLKLPPVRIGIIVAIGLIGAACAALLITLYGDHLGRRKSLIAIALLSAAGGVAIALVTNGYRARLYL